VDCGRLLPGVVPDRCTRIIGDGHGRANCPQWAGDWEEKETKQGCALLCIYGGPFASQSPALWDTAPYRSELYLIPATRRPVPGEW